jgi:lysophospholipase L1-like esterase
MHAAPPRSSVPDASTAAADTRWIATWGASPQGVALDDPDDPPLKVSGQTIRETVHLSLGGPRVRVRLSNLYGTSPLRVSAAHVALHASGPSIQAGSGRALTFGDSPAVIIPPGAQVVSDAVALPLAASSDLSVSLFLPGPVAATTVHSVALGPTYVSLAGDFAAATTLDHPTTTRSWYFLSEVEVETASTAATIVALGDSITDGVGSTAEANHRWTDFLAARLIARGSLRAVVNEGIAGNALLAEILGANMLARFDGDVLAQSGVKYVIFLAGINDIAGTTPPSEISTAQVIAGYRQLLTRAHAHGLKVIAATLLPFEGTKFPGFFTPAAETKREALNSWIRTSGAFDGFVDFDRVARDPARPSHILPAFDSGDHIHPNDAGYKAMADAIDLSLLDEAAGKAP